MRLKIDKLVTLLLLTLAFSGLFKAAPAQNEVYLETVWDAPATGNEEIRDIDFSRASQTVALQRQGFLNGLNAVKSSARIREIALSEQAGITEMSARLAWLDNYYDIVMCVGASSDQGTLYTGMTTGFFNIPMLIPFADGDLPEGDATSFIFRMTPDSDTYNDFFGNNIYPANLTRRINAMIFENQPIPDYTISAGVFFLDNPNGNEVAVKITQTMMENGIDIDIYQPFHHGELRNIFLELAAADQQTMLSLDTVLIIGEDQASVPGFKDIVSFWDQAQIPPAIVLLGVIPETEELADRENLYQVRQNLDLGQCPAEITAQAEAQGYAAGFITKHVLDQAFRGVKPERTGILTILDSPEKKHERHQDYLMEFRELIWSNLNAMDSVDIPCYGKGIKRPLEIVRFSGNARLTPMDNSEIFRYLVERIRVLYNGAYS